MQFVGMTNEDGINAALKVYIEAEIKGHGQITVVGYIGEGATMSLSSHWTAPFANDNLGNTSYMSKVGDYAQAGTDLTSKAEFNSILNWEGIEPPAIVLPIYFKAFRDPKKEVEDAIMYLQMMESPELHEKLPAGRVPATVDVNIGRRIKLTECVIQDVTAQLDSPKTNDGYRTENLVQVQLQRKKILNQSEIPSLYT